MSIMKLRSALRLGSMLLGVFVSGGHAAADTISLQTTLSTTGQNMFSAGEAVDLFYALPLFADPGPLAYLAAPGAAYLFGVGWGTREDPLTFSGGNVIGRTTMERVVTNPKYVKWQAQNALHNKSCITVAGKERCPVPKPAGPAPASKITIPAVDLGQYGVEFSGSTHGQFGLDFEAEFHAGKVSIDLPVEVEFTFDRTEIIPGQTFTLNSTGWVSPDAALDTLSPTAEARIMLNTDMKLESAGKLLTGAGDPEDINLLPGIDVLDRHELLAVGTDGLKLFDIPVGELGGTALDAAGDFAVKEILGDLEVSKLKIARALAARKGLSSSEKALQNAEKELNEIDAAEKENEKNIARMDKELNDSVNAIAKADEESGGNRDRIAEIDDMDTSGLSSDEKNALATEKSGLVARNARLDSRTQALSSQTAKLHDEMDEAREKDKKLKQDQDKKKTELATKQATRDSNKDDYKSRKDAVVEDAASNKKKDKLGSLIKAIDADFSVPVVETQGGVDLPGAGSAVTLNSTGEAQFLELTLDVDQFLSIIAKAGIAGAVTAGTAGLGTAAVKLIPNLSDEYSIGDFLQAEYATLDLGLGVRAFASQSFEFTPQFEIVLDTGTGSPMVFDLGESVDVFVPEMPGEFVLKPTLRVKGGSRNFTNSTGIRIEPFAELAVLGVTASVGFDAIGDLGFSVGPLVGTLQKNENGVDDLIPNDYPLDTLPVIEIGALSGSWELGGFKTRSLGAITLESSPLTVIPGGDFDSLDEWNIYGSVEIEDGMAVMTTASPVALTTELDTPAGPFSLLYDYRFEGAMGGILTVLLDSLIIDSIQAISSSALQTRSVYIDNPRFDSMLGLLLEFEYLDETGSVLYLDNIRTSGVASLSSVTGPQPAPEPSTLLLLAAAAIFIRLRSKPPRANAAIRV